MSDLTAIMDKLEIERTISSLGRCLDERDFEGLRDLAHQDAVEFPRLDDEPSRSSPRQGVTNRSRAVQNGEFGGDRPRNLVNVDAKVDVAA